MENRLSLAGENVAFVLSKAEARLKNAGISDSRRDARLMLSKAMGNTHPALLDPICVIPKKANHVFENWVKRREKREPVSRIFGYREFWGLNFEINSHTLDPRPDSEALVFAAIESFKGKNPPKKILDIGTGSGCILCALLKEFPSAYGVGIDINPKALVLAQSNSILNGLGNRVNYLSSDIDSGLNAKFDIVISNPPYISKASIETLDPEVSIYEPRIAIDGGDDGLMVIRKLVTRLNNLTEPKGMVFIEVGLGQADEVAQLLTNEGFHIDSYVKDLSGHKRVVRAFPGKEITKS